MEYLNLPVGEEAHDWMGVRWKRTKLRDNSSTYEDNHYYVPVECYCDVDCGGGYTVADEYGYGECSHCKGCTDVESACVC